jgi:uncharacterized protein
MNTKKQKRTTLERLLSRSYGKESSKFWGGGPRGLMLEDVRRYLDEGGDVNGRFGSGDTLFHNAASNVEIEIVRLLVARGADVNAKGSHGYTPLHHAVDMECNTQSRVGYSRASELPLTRVLIDAGADETLRDDDDKSARDIAGAYGEAETRLYDSLPRQQHGRNHAPPA